MQQLHMKDFSHIYCVLKEEQIKAQDQERGKKKGNLENLLLHWQPGEPFYFGSLSLVSLNHEHPKCYLKIMKHLLFLHLDP